MVHLWRAVDLEGGVLESYITKTRDMDAAPTFLKKALMRHGSPEKMTADGFRSYKAAMNELGNAEKQEIGHAGRVAVAHGLSSRAQRLSSVIRRRVAIRLTEPIGSVIHLKDEYAVRRQPLKPVPASPAS